VPDAPFSTTFLFDARDLSQHKWGTYGLVDYPEGGEFRRTILALNVITVSPQTQQSPSGIVVALHGWGSNAQDLASLVPFLNLPDYLFLLPQASFPHPNALGGWMWYDFQPGYRGVSESRHLLREWLQTLETETGVPLSRTVLAGFSQGAAMTLDVGVTLPLAGLIALSGYLHPLEQALPTPTPPVLIVHGRQDSVVPLSAAQTARDTLAAAGVAVDYHELDMGHEIKPAAFPLLHNFVHTVTANPGSGVV
jgi:phospholipase/carboxylesterase